MELIQELDSKSAELTASIRTLRQHGTTLAQAEHDYKVAVSQEVMRMRDAGTAVTLINLIIYGQIEIARLRLKRDIAQVMYDTNQEHINVIKLQIRIIENQIQREYNDR